MNPSSEKEAAKVIERLLPDDNSRALLLAVFVGAIREANQYGRASWAVRYLNDRVRLYTGHLIVATIVKGEIWMALEKKSIGRAEESKLNASDSWRWPPADEDYREYKEISSRNGYLSLSSDYREVWPLVRRCHFNFIYRAALQTDMDPRTARGHSSGVLKYLRNNLGEHVPDPRF